MPPVSNPASLTSTFGEELKVISMGKRNSVFVAVAMLIVGTLGVWLVYRSVGMISEAEARGMATDYRDQWIQKEQSVASSHLRIGQIRSSERTDDGWHIVFVTETGHQYPTSMHDYYLHVYIDRKGQLQRIVRGPDLMS